MSKRKKKKEDMPMHTIKAREGKPGPLSKAQFWSVPWQVDVVLTVSKAKRKPTFKLVPA